MQGDRPVANSSAEPSSPAAWPTVTPPISRRLPSVVDGNAGAPCRPRELTERGARATSRDSSVTCATRPPGRTSLHGYDIAGLSRCHRTSRFTMNRVLLLPLRTGVPSPEGRTPHGFPRPPQPNTPHRSPDRDGRTRRCRPADQRRRPRRGGHPRRHALRGRERPAGQWGHHSDRSEAGHTAAVPVCPGATARRQGQGSRGAGREEPGRTPDQRRPCLPAGRPRRQPGAGAVGRGQGGRERVDGQHHQDHDGHRGAQAPGVAEPADHGEAGVPGLRPEGRRQHRRPPDRRHADRRACCTPC